MNFYKYKYLSFFTLCLTSIILFSFSPFLAQKSVLTNICGKIGYLIFLGSLGVYFFSTSFCKKKFIRICLFLSILFLYIVLGVKSSGTNAVVSYFVNFGLPLFIVLFLYADTKRYILFSSYEKSIFFFILYFCAFLNCIYSIYLVHTFNGDLSSLYIANGKYSDFNYIRNGKLRAFGFLNSAVTFSNYISIILITVIFRIKVKKNFLLRLFFISIMFYSLYLSGSRTPLLSLFATLLILFLFRNKNKKFIPIISVLFIILILIFVSIKAEDLSALGRIRQYLRGIDLFVHNPIGHGFGYASFPDGQELFDCSILTIPVNFGLLGLLILLILYSKTIKSNERNSNGTIRNALLINTFISSGFVNVVNLGLLTMVIFIYYFKARYNEENISYSTLQV